jgi:subtilisin family serine protease
LGALQVVKLTALMERYSGAPEVIIGLIDGPVAIGHIDLTTQNIFEIPGKSGSICSTVSSSACVHGTFVAGVLAAKRGSAAPAICPGCTLLLRSIFSETTRVDERMPSATCEELRAAIMDTLQAGARLINLSAALEQSSSRGEQQLQQALDHAARRGTIIVAAAGNQGAVASSTITRHPWVIPVVACDLQGHPTAESNLGTSIGWRGLRAPGESIISLGADGSTLSLSGTSAATPFVTGAIALLWSAFPGATAAQVKVAITQATRQSRRSLVPPLMDAWAAYEAMAG